MKLPNNNNNDKIVDNMEAQDRHSPISQWVLALVLIAIPCLMIVFGLLTNTSFLIKLASWAIPIEFILVILLRINSMRLSDNDKVTDNAEILDRHSPMSQRVLALVLIAIPCLMIVFGLLTGTLIEPDASNIIYSIGLYLPTVMVVAFLVLSRFLFKNNPRLRIASQWTLRSYTQSVMGLDEREKQVIDQAFRTSYRIIALACLLALICIPNTDALHLHLLYHPDIISNLSIALGAAGILSYLPMAIVAWKEEI